MDVSTTVETEVPQIPDPRQDNILEALRAIKETIEVREGARGDPLDQAVTYRDLYRAGKLDISAITGNVMVRFPTGDLAFLPISRGVSDEFAAPPAPTNVVATGALTTVIIEFDDPSYHNHSHSEIWRSGMDNLSTAVKIGTTLGPASLYADAIGQTGITRYYWVRHVSQAGIVGPFQGTAGVSATLGFVQTAHLADALITAVKIATGAVTTDALASVAVTAAKIALGAVGVTQLADATVTVAKHAAGLRPVEILASLPAPGTEGRHVYLTTDDKLYRDTGSGWTTAVAASDVSGTLSTAQIADGAVTTAKLALLAVTGDILAAGAVTETKITDDAITSPKILAGAITTVKLAALAVTASEIAADAVIAVKIATGAVTTAKLDALAVTADKLAANSVIAGKIAAAVVSATELAANAVTAAKLSIMQHAVTGATFTSNSPGAGSVAWTAHTIQWNGNSYSISAGNTSAAVIWFDRSTSTTALQGSTRSAFEAAYNADDGDMLLASNTSGTYEIIYNATLVSGGMIRTGAIVADHIAASAVTAGKIAVGAIIAGDGAIANLAIDTAQIQNSAITNAKIGLLAVDSAKIADAAIVEAKIADLNVTTGKFANLSVTTGKIALLAITTALINDLAVTTAKIADANITTAKIASANITTALIADANVTTAKIAAANITTALIGDLQVTAAKIASATITNAQIASATITLANINTATITSLSALSADMGTITAGTIALASSGHIRAGQTGYNTGTGFWLGFDGATPKFSVGSSSKSLYWDGSDLTVNGQIIAPTNTLNHTAGSTMIISSDLEKQTTASSGSTPTVLKEIRLARGGTVTVKFTLRAAGGGTTGKGRIYKNGVAFGTERDIVAVATTEFTENLTFAAGDLVQLYVWWTAGTAVYGSNFRLYSANGGFTDWVTLA